MIDPQHEDRWPALLLLTKSPGQSLFGGMRRCCATWYEAISAIDSGIHCRAGSEQMKAVRITLGICMTLAGLGLGIASLFVMRYTLAYVIVYLVNPDDIGGRTPEVFAEVAGYVAGTVLMLVVVIYLIIKGLRKIDRGLI